jgi:menaquinol-cytochrome c reductase iron-sulfur subunit
MGQDPDRRSFLRWAIRGLSGLFAVVLGIPAVAFLIDGRNRPARQTGFRTVALLNELQPNKPKLVVITASWRDAWTVYFNDVIGRVWLVLRADKQVDAFTATCPHLGCSVNFTGSEFLCPCHGGRFDLNGQRKEEQDRPNPAPRNMDRLNVNPDALRQKIVQVEYQKFLSGKEEKIVRS